MGAFETQAAPIALVVSKLDDESDGDYSAGAGTINLTLFDDGLGADEAGPSAFVIRSQINILGPGGNNGIVGVIVHDPDATIDGTAPGTAGFFAFAWRQGRGRVVFGPNAGVDAT
jgi:hypothetical protein